MEEHSYSSGVGSQFEESSEQLYHRPEDDADSIERTYNAAELYYGAPVAGVAFDSELKVFEAAQNACATYQEQEKAECDVQAEHREGVGGYYEYALLVAFDGIKAEKQPLKAEGAYGGAVRDQIVAEVEYHDYNDKSFDYDFYSRIDEGQQALELPQAVGEQKQQEQQVVAGEKVGVESFNADEFCGSDVDDTIQPEALNAENAAYKVAPSSIVQTGNVASENALAITYTDRAVVNEYVPNVAEFGSMVPLSESRAVESADVKSYGKQQSDDFGANSFAAPTGSQRYALIVNTVVDGIELDFTEFAKSQGFYCEVQQYFANGAAIPKTLALIFANRTIATNALVLMWTLHCGIKVVQCREDCIGNIAAILSDRDFGICLAGLPKECREKDIRDMLRDNTHVIGVKLSGGDALLAFDDKKAAADALAQCIKVFQDNSATIKAQKAVDDYFEAFFGQEESWQQNADDFRDATEESLEWKKQGYYLDQLHDSYSKKKQKPVQQEPKPGRVWPYQKAVPIVSQKPMVALKPIDKIEITIDEPVTQPKEAKPKIVVPRAKTSDLTTQGQPPKQSRPKKMQSYNQREPAKINKIEIAPIEPGPLNSIELRPHVDQARYGELCRQFTVLCSQMEGNLKAFSRMDFSRFGAK